MEVDVSCHSKEELENMLEDVVNELDLSEGVISEHGPMGTPPSRLVRLVLDQKDKVIQMLKAQMIEVTLIPLKKKF
jgi:histidinol phosphatase-like PHP family hydrolase